MQRQFFMKVLFYILTVLFAVTTSFAELPVKVDFAVFNFNDSLNLLEVYYSFPDNCLEYKQTDKFKKSVIGFAIGVMKDTSIIDSTQWIQEVNIPLKNKDYVSDLVGIKTLLIPKQKLKIKFVALDMITRQNSFRRTFNISPKFFPSKEISISDIQIASMIEHKDKASQKWNKAFLKNSLYVVPDPGRSIIGSSPKIFSYFEIYNAKKYAPQGLLIKYTINNAAQKEVFSISRKKKSFSDAMVEYISIPVDALPTGVYYFVVTVKPKNDNDKAKIISSTKKIYMVNYEVPPENIAEFYENKSFEQSEFATLTPEKVKTFYDKIKFLATDYEKEVWGKCETVGAKRRFLFTFWSARNSDTTLPYNKALEEFRERIRYTNKHFKYGLMKEGWRTPRGRVYIKYGPPTRIERFVQEGEKPAYEKWFYDEYEGGVMFVFIDFRANGYYQLVHSSAQGEMYNDNWYEQYILKQDPDANFKYQKSNNWQQ